MVTIKEIASKAGVSTTSVSYALNGSTEISDATRLKILKIANEIGYQPNSIAKSLRTKKTLTIGVIAEDITVFNIPEIINGIGEYSEGKGYNLILNNLRLYKRLGNNYSQISKFKREITDVINIIINKHVDGFIYIGAHYRDVTGIVENIENPIVYTYCFTSEKGGNWVNYNDEDTAYAVTKYLIDKGHSRIAAITGMTESIPSQKRLKGFQRAIIDNQIIINPYYLKVGNWEYKSGYQMAVELLSQEKPPTAIFAFNDAMAEGVLEAASARGLKVPDDLSLIGFDNMDYCNYLSPRLTSVKLPLVEMGVSAAELLIDILENKRKPGHTIKLECSIVERESVVALKE